MPPTEGIEYDLTDVAVLQRPKKRKRCRGSNKGADKGAVECAADGDADGHADVDFDADDIYAYSPSDEGSECSPLDYEDLMNYSESEDERPLSKLKPACDPSTHPQSRGETEEAGESAHQSTNPQPMPRGTNPQPMPRSSNRQRMPRGENEEAGADGRMFTVLRGKEGEVAGYSLKCKWHRGEDCVRDLKLGAINPMTVRECQLRLLRWEEAGRGLPEPARAAHKDLGSAQLLTNFAS